LGKAAAPFGDSYMLEPVRGSYIIYMQRNDVNDFDMALHFSTMISTSDALTTRMMIERTLLGFRKTGEKFTNDTE